MIKLRIERAIAVSFLTAIISSLIGLNKNLGYNTFINKNILSFLKPDRIIQKKLCDDWNSL